MTSSFDSLLTWFFREIPVFLMSEPIIYFIGIAFFVAVIALLKRIINISR